MAALKGNREAAAAGGGAGLVAWAARSGRPESRGRVRGGLRFVFYGRVSTEDWQDPVTSRARQREQAGALVRGHGVVVAELHRPGPVADVPNRSSPVVSSRRRADGTAPASRRTVRAR